MEVQKLSGEKVYNLGVDGPTIFEIRRLFEFGLKNSNVSSAILGLELLSFNGARKKELPNLSSSRRLRLDMNNPQYNYLSVSETLENLLPIRVLGDSMNTLISQSAAPYYTELGFIASPIKSAALYNHENIFSLSKKAYSNMLRPFSYEFSDRTSTLSEFRKIVRLAYENDIDLSVVYSPIHSFWKDEMSNEFREIFETMKMEVAIILSEESSAYAASEFNVYDFTGPRVENSEPIPAPSSSLMNYWYDSYHFRPSYGNLMLQEIFKNGASGN